MSKDCKSNHRTIANNNIAELLLHTLDQLFTAFSFFLLFKSKISFLFIFKFVLKNNLINEYNK